VIPTAASTPLVAVELMASSIWVGGLVAIFVVALAASVTLDAPARIEFFRALGRRYGIVGGGALLVAIGSGAGLLADHPWEWRLIVTAVLASNLLLVTATGIWQARRMTRLRRRALCDPRPALEESVRRGALAAHMLRGAIGLTTLALVLLVSALAS
jgi:uncharacterized membrane protein